MASCRQTEELEVVGILDRIAHELGVERGRECSKLVKALPWRPRRSVAICASSSLRDHPFSTALPAYQRRASPSASLVMSVMFCPHGNCRNGLLDNFFAASLARPAISEAAHVMEVRPREPGHVGELTPEVDRQTINDLGTPPLPLLAVQDVLANLPVKLMSSLLTASAARVRAAAIRPLMPARHWRIVVGQPPGRGSEGLAHARSPGEAYAEGQQWGRPSESEMWRDIDRQE